MKRYKTGIYKQLMVLLLVLILAIPVQSQTWAEKLGYPSGRKIIMLHADDIGMSPGANTSAVYYLQNEMIQSAAVMVPCPGYEEIADWRRQYQEFDLGLHLTLTSEWKTYRWPTVVDTDKVPGLIDPEGKMWHSVRQVVSSASAEEVEAEIRAQIERAIADGFNPSHIDTHMGTLYGHHDYTGAYLKVAEEYRIPAMVISMQNPVVVEHFKKAGYPVTEEMISHVKNYSLPKLDFFTSVPTGKTYEEKLENFKSLVKELPNGITEIIFHPSDHSEELKEITNSWQQRVWEAEMFADPDLWKFFEEEEIIFTNWKEMMDRFDD